MSGFCDTATDAERHVQDGRSPSTIERPAEEISPGRGIGGPGLLSGRVASCTCPDCGVPMAIRMWLMTADCWQCGASISLSYLAEVGAASPTAAAQTPAGTQVATHRPAVLPPHFEAPRRSRWQDRLLEAVACLLSVAAHLLLLILLALLTMGVSETPAPQITLSLDVNPRSNEGRTPQDRYEIQQVGFEMPVRTPDNPLSAVEARQWARQLQLGKRDPAPNLPPLERLQESLASDDRYRRMLSARDPRIRQQVIVKQGGTTQTEAAVARALYWFSLHQHPDGSWPLQAFPHASDCQGRCGDAGQIRSASGGTALVLQTMLGAGQTHRMGIYRDAVSQGLQFLVHLQHADGDLRGDTPGSAGMYAHALASIALCDALALTGDEHLRDPAQRAIDFIAGAQHPHGGWRYQPGQAGDTSVVGWQLMALHSARAARLDVPDEAFLGAFNYLDDAQVDRAGAYYAYRPGGPATAAMTAEGLLSRMYLGWRRDDPGLQRGVLALLNEHPPSRNQTNIYYWYYATQVMHHWGGRAWVQWNRPMRDILVNTQRTAGHEAGSWDPITPHGHQGGRLYMTALACCILEVYYRHAPLFRKIELD